MGRGGVVGRGMKPCMRERTEKVTWFYINTTSVADPDPHVFGPPGSGSGSTSQRYGAGSFYHHAKIVRKTLIPTIL